MVANMMQLFQVAHPPDGRRDPSVHRTWGEGAWLLIGVLFGVGIGNTIQVECLCMIIPEYYAPKPNSIHERPYTRRPHAARPLHRYARLQPCSEWHLHVACALRHHLRAARGRLQPGRQNPAHVFLSTVPIIP